MHEDIAALDSQCYAEFSKDGYQGVCRWYKNVSKIVGVREHSKTLRILCVYIGEPTTIILIFNHHAHAVSLDTPCKCGSIPVCASIL